MDTQNQTRYRNVNIAIALENAWGIKPESSVLVLNATYEPINITSWKRAIILLVKEKATIISEKVIRLIDYVRVPVSKIMEAKPSRAMIYKRDGHKCQYCGSTRGLTIDHVIPKSRGGGDTWQNLVVACSKCNTFKSNKLLEHTGMKLVRKPTAPANKIIFVISQTKDPEWQQYNYI
jgi:5-methylcytosine-specific restriction endonuclease McrA